MVPVSQVLAKIGITGPYMKYLSDKEIIQAVESAGGKLVALRKHNLYCLKQHLRGEILTDAITLEWHAFEDRMNKLMTPAQLDSMFWATIVVMEKV